MPALEQIKVTIAFGLNETSEIICHTNSYKIKFRENQIVDIEGRVAWSQIHTYDLIDEVIEIRNHIAPEDII